MHKKLTYSLPGLVTKFSLNNSWCCVPKSATAVWWNLKLRKRDIHCDLQISSNSPFNSIFRMKTILLNFYSKICC